MNVQEFGLFADVDLRQDGEGEGETQEDQDADDRGAQVAALVAHLRGRGVHVVHGLVRVARAGDGRQAERRHGQVPEDHRVLQAPLEAVPAEGLGLGGPGKQVGQAGEENSREHEHHRVSQRGKEADAVEQFLAALGLDKGVVAREEVQEFVGLDHPPRHVAARHRADTRDGLQGRH